MALFEGAAASKVPLLEDVDVRGELGRWEAVVVGVRVLLVVTT